MLKAAGVGFYLGDERREWESWYSCQQMFQDTTIDRGFSHGILTSISRKRPQLARCSGNFADNGRGENYDDDRSHCVRRGVALRCVEEELNERILGVRVQETVDVTECKANGDDHDEPHDPIDNHPRDNSLR